MTEPLRIALSDIKPDPDQPRKYFDPDKLHEFADHLKVVGVKQPIAVRVNPDAGKHDEPPYMIVAGERRWTASGMAGLEDIPAVVETQELDYDSIYKHQLSENFFRENLNAVEEAEHIGKRIEYLKSTGVSNASEVAASELGVSVSWISRKVAILKYAPDVRALAREGHVRDYRALRKIDKLEGERRKEALEQIEKGEFNSKEFFSRRRRKKQPDSEAPVQSQPQIGLQMTTDSWTKLIEKTEYVHMLDRTDPEWRNADPAQLRNYLKSFRDWCAGTE